MNKLLKLLLSPLLSALLLSPYVGADEERLGQTMERRVYSKHRAALMDRLAPAKEDPLPICRFAMNQLHNLQVAQYQLTDRKGKTLLQLEQDLDQAIAHQTMVKGMFHLNREYLKAKEALDSVTLMHGRSSKAETEDTGDKDSATKGPDFDIYVKKKMLSYSDIVLKHHKAAKDVYTADIMLKALSGDIASDDSGSLRKRLVATIQKGGDQIGTKVQQAFADYCGENIEKRCKGLMTKSSGGKLVWSGGSAKQQVFTGRLSELLALSLKEKNSCYSSECLARARSEEKKDACLISSKCIEKAAEEMVEKVNLYRDILQRDINTAEIGKSAFADAEFKAAKDWHDKYKDCNENCGDIQKSYLTSLRNYRDEVRTLGKNHKGGDQAWKALSNFKKAADNLRVDDITVGSHNKALSGKVSNAKIDAYLRASPKKRLVLDQGMTPAEQSLGRFRAAKADLVATLRGDKSARQRDKMRQRFKQERKLASLFSDKSVEERATKFNNLMARLTADLVPKCEKAACQVAFVDKDGKLAIDENKFADYISFVALEDRTALNKRVSEEKKKIDGKIETLQARIRNLRRGKDHVGIDKLKRHYYGIFSRRCGNKPEFDTVLTKCTSIDAAANLAAGSQLEFLFNSGGQIIGHLNRRAHASNLKELDSICRSKRFDNNKVVRSACGSVMREYANSIKPTKLQRRIKAARKMTRTYTRDGKLEGRDTHNYSFWSVARKALGQSLGQNLDVIALWGQGQQVDEYLNYMVVSGTMEKEYRFHQKWYQDYWRNYYFGGANGAPPPSGFNFFGSNIGLPYGHPGFSDIYNADPGLFSPKLPYPIPDHQFTPVPQEGPIPDHRFTPVPQYPPTR